MTLAPHHFVRCRCKRRRQNPGSRKNSVSTLLPRISFGCCQAVSSEGFENQRDGRPSTAKCEFRREPAARKGRCGFHEIYGKTVQDQGQRTGECVIAAAWGRDGVRGECAQAHQRKRHEKSPQRFMTAKHERS